MIDVDVSIVRRFHSCAVGNTDGDAFGGSVLIVAREVGTEAMA